MPKTLISSSDFWERISLMHFCIWFIKMNLFNKPIPWNESLFIMLHNTERKNILGELSIHLITIKASVVVKWIGQDKSWCSWHMAVNLNCLKQLFTTWIHSFMTCYKFEGGTIVQKMSLYVNWEQKLAAMVMTDCDKEVWGQCFL